MIIWKPHVPFYERGGSYERPASVGAVPTYNNMEITNNVGPNNRYWFELVRRQARNVYLNMMHGSDLHRQSWGSTPTRMWRRVSSQPLRRLPARIVRKLGRNLASFFA